MRLFLKHLVRSIRKRPLQPIIIVATIILTVLTLVLSLGIKQAITDELDAVDASKYGTSDFAIGLTGESNSRFMFADKANELLEGKATAVGSYELIFTYETENAVVGKAVDFYEIGKLFDFSFVEYAEIREESLKTTIIITREFAQSQSLGLGDKIELVLFGEKTEYEICAISDKPLFDQCDVMLDIRSVMGALSKKSLFISALGEDFLPYSTINVDVNDDSSIEECIEILKQDDMFAYKDFELANTSNSGFVTLVLPIAVNFCILLILFCGANVIFSCFCILSRQRTEQNQSFEIAGAKKTMLNSMQYLEALLYWLVGAPLGLLLSIPIFEAMQAYLDFRYTVIGISLKNSIIVIALMLLTTFLTIAVFIYVKDRKRTTKTTSKAVAISFFLITVASLVVLLLSKGEARLPLGLLCVAFVLLFLFFTTPYLFLVFVSFVSNRMEKKQKSGKKIKLLSLYYALKNSHRVKVLQNLTRLAAVLFTVITCTVLVVGASNGHVKATTEMLGGDYLVMNATDSCHDIIKDSEHLESVYKVYRSNVEYENGFTSMLLSSDDKSAFGKKLGITSLPTGNNAIVSSTDAKLLELDVGDALTIETDGKELNLCVSKIVNMGTMAIIVDATSLDLPTNFLVVDAKDGEEKELLEDITAASAKELSTVIPSENFQKQRIDKNLCLLKCANLLMIIVFVFALVGFANNLYESYMSRKEELGLYHYAGLSSKKITKMIAWEIALMLAFGIVLGIVACGMILPSLDKAFNQIHFEIVGYFEYLFR